VIVVIVLAATSVSPLADRLFFLFQRIFFLSGLDLGAGLGKIAGRDVQLLGEETDDVCTSHLASCATWGRQLFGQSLCIFEMRQVAPHELQDLMEFRSLLATNASQRLERGGAV